MQQIEGYMIQNGGVIISRIICFGLLVSLSVMDIKYRSIPGSLLVLGSVLAGFYCIWFDRDMVWLNLGGLLVGLFFVLVSRVTREGLGYGDSWLFSALGLYLGIWSFLELLAAAWVGTMAVAAILLMTRRFKRKTALPMVPFITAGYVVMWISEAIG